MATVHLSVDHLTVRLGRAEKVFALHGDVVVPRSAVRGVEVVDDPLGAIRGLRLPGTAVPWRLALGTWRRRGTWDFVIAYWDRPGVVVTLDDAVQRFARLIVSTEGADTLAESF